MVTTFTKKAAEEMISRLEPLISKMALQQLTIGTTHSIGYRILKKEYEAMGNPLYNAFNKNNGIMFNGVLKIFGENIKKALILDRTLPFEVKEQLKDIPVPQLLKAAGSWKNQGLDYYDVESSLDQDDSRAVAYSEFYTKYESVKRVDQLLDGDDLIFLLWKLFKEDTDILKKYQGYYKYILVDEAQDNNGIQYDLFNMLCQPQKNLFVVGDDDQSMYSFRGARPDQFINFKLNYPGTSTISLEDNYRSHPHVLQVANSIIKNNTVRIQKQLKANKPDDGQEVVSYSRHTDEDTEAKSVVDQISISIEKDGVKPKDIAVLFRTNAQSRSIEEHLIIQGIPYVIHGGVSFYERKEVKDIIAYLQMAIDPTNDKAFKRVVNIPSRYLGKAFLEKVASYRGTHWDAIQGGITMKDYEVRGTNDFVRTVESIREFMQDNPLEETVNFILNSFYRKYLEDNGEDEEDVARLENLETLKFAMSRYSNINEFLDYIEFMNSTAKTSIDGVQLMTIHKSKGLEFDHVYLIGFSQGTLPHFRAVEASMGGNIQPIEEERRLLYVAATRAINICRMSSPMNVNGKPCAPSQFTKELGINVGKIEDDDDHLFEMLMSEADLEYEKAKVEEQLNSMTLNINSLQTMEEYKMGMLPMENLETVRNMVDGCPTMQDVDRAQQLLKSTFRML